MYLPQNRSKTLAFGAIPNEEFFAPEFEVVAATGELLLWPYSRDTTYESKEGKKHNKRYVTPPTATTNFIII